MTIALHVKIAEKLLQIFLVIPATTATTNNTNNTATICGRSGDSSSDLVFCLSWTFVIYSTYSPRLQLYRSVTIMLTKF